MFNRTVSLQSELLIQYDFYETILFNESIKKIYKSIMNSWIGCLNRSKDSLTEPKVITSNQLKIEYVNSKKYVKVKSPCSQ